MDWKKAKKSTNVVRAGDDFKARPKGDPLAPRPGFFFTDYARYRVMRGDKAAAQAFPKVTDKRITGIVKALREEKAD